MSKYAPTTIAMSEYTPTTEEIREYVECGGEYRPWTRPGDPLEGLRAAAFDRWLAEHDHVKDAEIAQLQAKLDAAIKVLNVVETAVAEWAIPQPGSLTKAIGSIIEKAGE